MWAAETVQGRFLRSRNVLAVLSSWPGVPAGGQARVGCRSSLRRGRGGMMGFAVHWPAGSIRGATTPGVGGHDLPRPAPTRDKPKAVFMPPPAGVPGAPAGREEAGLGRAPAGGAGADVAASAVGDSFA